MKLNYKIIIAVVALIIAIYLLAPLKDWKRGQKLRDNRDYQVQYITAPKQKSNTQLYIEHCRYWWGNLFSKHKQGAILVETPVDPLPTPAHYGCGTADVYWKTKELLEKQV